VGSLACGAACSLVLPRAGRAKWAVVLFDHCLTTIRPLFGQAVVVCGDLNYRIDGIDASAIKARANKVSPLAPAVRGARLLSENGGTMHAIHHSAMHPMSRLQRHGGLTTYGLTTCGLTAGVPSHPVRPSYCRIHASYCLLLRARRPPRTRYAAGACVGAGDGVGGRGTGRGCCPTTSSPESAPPVRTRSMAWLDLPPVRTRFMA
jgi:hypothetical protein